MINLQDKSYTQFAQPFAKHRARGDWTEVLNAVPSSKL